MHGVNGGQITMGAWGMGDLTPQSITRPKDLLQWHLDGVTRKQTCFDYYR